MFFTLAFRPTYSTTGDSAGISSSRRSAPGRAAVRSRSTSIPFGTSAIRAGETLHVRITN